MPQRKGKPFHPARSTCLPGRNHRSRLGKISRPTRRIVKRFGRRQKATFTSHLQLHICGEERYKKKNHQGNNGNHFFFSCIGKRFSRNRQSKGSSRNAAKKKRKEKKKNC